MTDQQNTHLQNSHLQNSGSVDLVVEGVIATLLINNEASRNAMNQTMWRQLRAHVKTIEADSAIRVVVLSSVGEKAFCAGADISEFREFAKDPASLAASNDDIQQAQMDLENLSRPTIAKISGACMGGGCGLALACDFRIATDTAKFAITPAKLGLLYSVSDTRRLYNLVGSGITKELLYTGKVITAEQADHYGMLTERVAVGDLDKTVDQLAQQFVQGSQYSLRGIKAVMATLEGHPIKTDTEIETLFTQAFTQSDNREGVAAFMDKRAPDFKWPESEK
jgi:enoyl-CoA hydratase